MDCAIEIDRLQTPHGLRSPICCRIAKGCMTGIIGPNGAGKSTLLRSIAGLQKKTAGRILILQRDLDAIPQKALAKTFAYLPQQIEIIEDFTVSELISLGRLPHHPGFWERLRGQKTDFERDHKAVQEALEAMHLEDLAQRTATTLSGGELQRVYLARALAQETPILLLDEPTAHLDFKASLELLNCLEKRLLQQELTVVMAIHDLNLAALYCQRLLLLNEGQLLAEGTPETVLSPEILEPAYGRQLKRIPHPLCHRPQILPCRAAQN